MRRGRATAVAAIATSGLVGLGLTVTTGAAHAGVNGQRITVCADGVDYERVSILGSAATGALQEAEVAFSEGCVPIVGLGGREFRWAGEVTIVLHTSPSAAVPVSAGCNVPMEAPTDDFFECLIDQFPAKESDVEEPDIALLAE